ncbi:helix-turn-helix transcriptional regulator [Longispora sp. K20-0274]|uniref:helix-turn-helix domain-containing protein n=1 Tax=Longispora sp. K20-0274 TaxID=3088255 RepID=UPI003999C86F
MEVAQPRQLLGIELRRCRRLAGLNGRDLASQLGITQAKVSRIETARFRPEIAIVRAWLKATNADEATTTRLLELGRKAQTDVSGWRASFRGSMAGRIRELGKQDAVASRVRHFQPFMIPGIFHTADYARAALKAVRPAPEAEVEAAVLARLERGDRILTSGLPAYEIILTELALRWTPLDAPPSARAGTLARLRSGVHRQHVTVRVVPADAPTRQAPMCAFVMYEYSSGEQPTVDVELPAVEMRFADPEDVAAFDVAWQRMADAALPPQESLQFIAELERSLSHPEE